MGWDAIASNFHLANNRGPHIVWYHRGGQAACVSVRLHLSDINRVSELLSLRQQSIRPARAPCKFLNAELVVDVIGVIKELFVCGERLATGWHPRSSQNQKLGLKTCWDGSTLSDPGQLNGLCASAVHDSTRSRATWRGACLERSKAITYIVPLVICDLTGSLQRDRRRWGSTSSTCRGQPTGDATASRSAAAGQGSATRPGAACQQSAATAQRSARDRLQHHFACRYKCYEHGRIRSRGPPQARAVPDRCLVSGRGCCATDSCCQSSL